MSSRYSKRVLWSAAFTGCAIVAALGTAFLFLERLTFAFLAVGVVVLYILVFEVLPGLHTLRKPKE